MLSLFAESAGLSQELVNRFLSLLQGGFEITNVEIVSAFGATEICIHFQFSEGLRKFMATLRAGDGNLKSI
jgi:hypothetical protein